MQDHKIDTSHFLGQRHNKGRTSNKRLSADEILIKGTNRIRASNLRRALTEKGVKEECVCCHNGPTWNGKHLCLQVDHIDGDPTNNVLINLRFVCPNCHSQTDTFGTKNRRRGGVADAQR